MPATPPPAGPEPAEPSGADAGSTENGFHPEVAETAPGAAEGATTDPATDLEAGPATDTVDWDELPEPVRVRLAELAAGAVTTLPSADVPTRIRPFARFTPAKRARLGGQLLVAGLRDSPAFRAAVTQWARQHRGEVLDPATENPADAAAAAVLLGADEAGTLVAEVARRSATARLRSERDAALARAERLEAENRKLAAELEEATAAVRQAGSEGDTEAARLRGRLREQGVRLREALDRAEHAAGDREAALAAARDEAAALRTERDRERERADQATRRAERALAETEKSRQALREARAADEVRLSLLLDTAKEAIRGLRQELALAEHGSLGGALPADLVRGASTARTGSRRADNAAALDRLLALPTAHLVVDGYNVTKTGYPQLTLSDQRARLTAQLAALAARTAVEITVVFDGAAVLTVPTTTTRGVRVLFSEPGVPADDLIRELVAAEPEGRPVIVATSDQEVAVAVRASGAHSAPSAVLLTRLPGS